MAMIWPSCRIVGAERPGSTSSTRAPNFAGLQIRRCFRAVKMSSTPGTARASVEIDAVDPALGDRAGDQDRVGRIGRPAYRRDSAPRPSPSAAHRSAARARPCCPSGRVLPHWPCQISSAAACCSARIKVRLPSSILNSLCARGPWRRRTPHRPPPTPVALIDRRCRAATPPPRCARHGTVATPPSAMRALRTSCRLVIERDRGRGQRELVGLAIAHLQVERPPRPRRRRESGTPRSFRRAADVVSIVRRVCRAGGAACANGNRARRRLARRFRPPRRARSAPGRNRRDRWRCIARWRRARHGRG